MTLKATIRVGIDDTTIIKTLSGPITIKVFEASSEDSFTDPAHIEVQIPGEKTWFIYPTDKLEIIAE